MSPPPTKAGYRSSTAPTPSLASLLRRRDVLVTTLLTCLLLTFLTISSHPNHPHSPNPASPSSSVASQAPDVEPLEVLAQLYEDERLSLLSTYDQNLSEVLVRAPHGSLNPDFGTYIQRLESFTSTWFAGHPLKGNITAMLGRLVTARPPTKGSRQFDRMIWSFDASGKEGVPAEFEYWNKRLGKGAEGQRMLEGEQEGAGWDIRVGDDEDMEEWFREATDQAGLERQMGEEKGSERWAEMWDGLGRPVHKSDLLRYLIMLTKGGLYTDSDTAPLSDPSLWGTNADDFTPPSLSVLQRAMRHLDPSFSTTLGDDIAQRPMARNTRGINDPRVSMVISIEYDVTHPRQDPRVAYTRDLQMVQWTFMAKPFHPIFLDVLETATDKIMTRRRGGNDEESLRSVLDVTGPGPFTDAVLRYLLVQYGVTPQDLFGMEDGALIGDVLILPLHAFGSYLGGEENWNADDPATRCVAHGFRGRWKGFSSPKPSPRRRRKT